MRMGPHSMMPSDPSAIEGASLDRSIVRRVGEFARPYRAQIAGFLAAIVAAALLGLVPPLVTKWIIDEAIPNGDRDQLSLIAGLAVQLRLSTWDLRPFDEGSDFLVAVLGAA